METTLYHVVGTRLRVLVEPGDSEPTATLLCGGCAPQFREGLAALAAVADKLGLWEPAAAFSGETQDGQFFEFAVGMSGRRDYFLRREWTEKHPLSGDRQISYTRRATIVHIHESMCGKLNEGVRGPLGALSSLIKSMPIEGGYAGLDGERYLAPIQPDECQVEEQSFEVAP